MVVFEFVGDVAVLFAVDLCVGLFVSLSFDCSFVVTIVDLVSCWASVVSVLYWVSTAGGVACNGSTGVFADDTDTVIDVCFDCAAVSVCDVGSCLALIGTDYGITIAAVGGCGPEAMMPCWDAVIDGCCVAAVPLDWTEDDVVCCDPITNVSHVDV